MTRSEEPPRAVKLFSSRSLSLCQLKHMAKGGAGGLASVGQDGTSNGSLCSDLGLVDRKMCRHPAMCNLRQLLGMGLSTDHGDVAFIAFVPAVTESSATLNRDREGPRGSSPPTPVRAEDVYGDSPSTVPRRTVN